MRPDAFNFLACSSTSDAKCHPLRLLAFELLVPAGQTPSGGLLECFCQVLGRRLHLLAVDDRVGDDSPDAVGRQGSYLNVSAIALGDSLISRRAWACKGSQPSFHA